MFCYESLPCSPKNIPMSSVVLNFPSPDPVGMTFGVGYRILSSFCGILAVLFSLIGFQCFWVLGSPSSLFLESFVAVLMVLMLEVCKYLFSVFLPPLFKVSQNLFPMLLPVGLGSLCHFLAMPFVIGFIDLRLCLSQGTLSPHSTISSGDASVELAGFQNG